MEAYVHGVSTRAVDELVERSGSAAGISEVRGQPHLRGPRRGGGGLSGAPARPHRVPLHLARRHLPARARRPPGDLQGRGHRHRGHRADGRREILGLDVGDSEDEVFWRGFLRSLKRRGLAGVRLVISDQHAGLVAAIGRCFQGAAHQRCRVHFARNLLATVPKGHQEMVAAAFRTIFAQASPEEIAAQWDHVAAMFAERFPKAAALMAGPRKRCSPSAPSPGPTGASSGRPTPWSGSTGSSSDAAGSSGIFPNEASVIRLGGAVVARHPRRVGLGRTAVLLRRLYGEALPANAMMTTATVGELEPAD